MQEFVADRRLCIPLEHRVDGLRELGATRLVDATGVYPDVFKPLGICDRSELPNLARKVLANREIFLNEIVRRVIPEMGDDIGVDLLDIL